jgi:hypothetical protein
VEIPFCAAAEAGAALARAPSTGWKGAGIALTMFPDVALPLKETWWAAKFAKIAWPTLNDLRSAGFFTVNSKLRPEALSRAVTSPERGSIRVMAQHGLPA